MQGRRIERHAQAFERGDQRSQQLRRRLAGVAHRDVITHLVSVGAHPTFRGPSMHAGATQRLGSLGRRQARERRRRPPVPGGRRRCGSARISVRHRAGSPCPSPCRHAGSKRAGRRRRPRKAATCLRLPGLPTPAADASSQPILGRRERASARHFGEKRPENPRSTTSTPLRLAKACAAAPRTRHGPFAAGADAPDAAAAAADAASAIATDLGLPPRHDGNRLGPGRGKSPGDPRPLPHAAETGTCGTRIPNSKLPKPPRRASV